MAERRWNPRASRLPSPQSGAPGISSSCLQTCVVVQSPSCLWLCHPTDWSKPGFPVPHHTLECAQVHVLCIMGAVEPSHPPMPPSPSALDLSQHQGLFQWLSGSMSSPKLSNDKNSSNLVRILESFGQGKTTHGFRRRRTSQQHSLLPNAGQELHQPQRLRGNSLIGQGASLGGEQVLRSRVR